MWKKIAAVFLALWMAVSGTLCANAAGSGVTAGTMVPFSYTSDDLIYREYIQADQNHTVRLTPGEYQTVYPFHWLNSNYFSYANVSVVSSDDSVVSASAYFPNQGKASDRAGSAGGFQENLGVKLHAKKSGKARVTVSYSTFLTRLGLNYRDKRGKDSFTQTIEVRVGEPLEMTVRFCDSSGMGVGDLLVQMREFGERAHPVQQGLDVGVQTAALFGLSPFPDFSDLIPVGIGIAVGALTFLATSAVVTPAVGLGLAVTAMQASMAVTEAFCLLKGTADLALTELAWKALKMPMYEPEDLQLEITLENKGDNQVSGVFYDITGNQYLAVESFSHTWGNTHSDFIRTIGPGESVVRTYDIDAKCVAGDTSEGGMRRVYTGSVRVEGRYTYPGQEEEIRLSEAAQLPVFSDITAEEMGKFSNGIQKFPEYYDKYFGTSNQGQLLYAACPVELLVCGSDGSQLAVIGTDEPDAFEAEGIQAGAMGEQKYVVLQAGYEEQYRFMLRAVDSGSMDVYTYEYDKESGMACRVYQEIPLTKGEIFEMRLQENQAGTVWNQDGEIEPLLSLDAENVEQRLQETDLSPQYLSPVSEAMLHGLVPGMEAESFQEPVSLEWFSQALLRVCGGVLGTEEECFTAKAASMGLLNQEYCAVEKTEAEQTLLTCEEAALAMWNCMKLLDRSEQPPQIYEEPETEETEPQPLDYVREKGILDGEDAPDGKDTLTLEQASAAIYELWSYCGVIAEGNQFIIKHSSALLEEMETFYPGILEWNGIHLRFADKERQGSAFGNFSVYHPAMFSLAHLFFAVENAGAYEAYGSRCANMVDYLTFFVKNYPDVYGNTEKPLDPEMITTDLLNSFTDAGEGGGSTVDLDGTVYRWMPVYCRNPDGSILNDEVYLFVSVEKQGVDTAVLEEKNIEMEGDCQAEDLFIADQELVVDYLTIIRPLLEQNAVSAPEAQEYEELSQGSAGDAVLALQEALISRGYLENAADGEYGDMTAEAVSAFQAESGLTATGIADGETQSRLFAAPQSEGILLNWLERRGL